MLAAACLNPAGPAMLAYPFKTAAIQSLQAGIQEWQSPNFHDIQVLPFALLILVLVLALGVSRRRVALTDALLAAVFLYLALSAARNIALFALIAPLVILRHLPPALAEWREAAGLPPPRPMAVKTPRLQARLNFFILLILGLAALATAVTAFSPQENNQVFASTLPLEAIDFIKTNQPPGRLFNSYNWGGYLLWALPDYPVFVDGRTDLYNDEIITQWFAVVSGQAGWEKVLEVWEVNLILVEKTQPLVARLEATNSGWVLLHQDDLAVVYGR
jgi:hypothetical protein